MPSAIRPGDVLAGRYRLVDLLTESGNGRFWRAHDRVLERHVALHVIAEDDERADALLEAARRSATVPDRRLLRVLDADRTEGLCFVVNEWGAGDSLDIMLAQGALDPRRAAWIVSEVAATIAIGHEAGIAHGRLIPENVLVDHAGGVRIIGFAVDAALHGLPPGRVSTDVADLGGLLYCALTGKWPGTSDSALPAAPLEGGRVLRPRQVRAGIPRPLDALCDEVVNPYSSGSRIREVHDLATAQGICDYLCAFVGDATGIAAAEAAAGHRGSETVSLPAMTDPPARQVEPAPEPDPEPGPTSEPIPEPEPGPPPTSTELPTEAGLPIFDDDNDDVSWLAAPGEPPPPPPPFEDPPERPLFAPSPSDGGPARTPRHPGPAGGGRDEYWPWGDTGASTGTGFRVFAEDEEPEPVPGRSSLRVAVVILACLLLLLAVVVAFNLGRGRGPLGTKSDDDPTTAPTSQAPTTATAGPIAGTTATDFDPQGDPPEENPELAPLAVDGKSDTTWRTNTYTQNLGPGGLKTGVGLVVDLHDTHAVSSVDVTVVGAPTAFSVYVTDEQPTDLTGLTPAAQATASEPRTQVDLDDTPEGRYVVVWLTSLPQVAGGFRGEIADITVNG